MKGVPCGNKKYNALLMENSTSGTKHLKTKPDFFFSSSHTEFPKTIWTVPGVDELLGEGPSYLLLIETLVPNSETPLGSVA